MLITIIIPGFFLVFMKVSMDRVWGLYLMLQFVSNVIQFNGLEPLNYNLPAPCYTVMTVMESTSNFKMIEEILKL